MQRISLALSALISRE